MNQNTVSAFVRLSKKVDECNIEKFLVDLNNYLGDLSHYDLTIEVLDIEVINAIASE